MTDGKTSDTQERLGSYLTALSLAAVKSTPWSVSLVASGCFIIMIENEMAKCRICSRIFKKRLKTRRDRKMQVGVRKWNTVTCSKICSKERNRRERTGTIIK